MAFPPTKEKEEVREGEAPMKEAKKGRMSGPLGVRDLDRAAVSIASRFGVAQGKLQVLCAHCHLMGPSPS